MDFIWLTLRTNVGRVCETPMCVLRKGKPCFHGEEFLDRLAYLVVIWPVE